MIRLSVANRNPFCIAESHEIACPLLQSGGANRVTSLVTASLFLYATNIPTNKTQLDKGKGT